MLDTPYTGYERKPLVGCQRKRAPRKCSTRCKPWVVHGVDLNLSPERYLYLCLYLSVYMYTLSIYSPTPVWDTGALSLQVTRSMYILCMYARCIPLRAYEVSPALECVVVRFDKGAQRSKTKSIKQDVLDTKLSSS